MHPAPPARTTRRALAVAALALAASAGRGAAAETRGAPLVPLRLANLAVGWGPQELAIEKGVFAKYGIDLKVINFIRGGAEATAGVASGDVDMGEYGSPILMGIASGLHIRIVGSPAIKINNFELVARKGIGSVKELKGQVVAGGELGGGSHQSLLKILHDNGLSENDVIVVATGGVNAEMVLRSGRVAAAVTTELIRLKLVDDGQATLIARARDYYGRYQHSYIFASDEFIRLHPTTIRNFLRAKREAYEYGKAHLDELIDFTGSRVKVKREIIRAYYDEQIPQWDLTFAVDLEGTENAVKILQDLKEVKPNVRFDPKTWLDLRFLG
jgi:NitT/TauT family transport system substrate-binding protein